MMLDRLLHRPDPRIARRLREIAEPIPPRAVPGCAECAIHAEALGRDVARAWARHIARDHWRTAA